MVESNFQHLTESHLITLGYEIPHILQVLGITTILTSIVTILASIEQVNTPLVHVIVTKLDSLVFWVFLLWGKTEGTVFLRGFFYVVLLVLLPKC